MSSTHEHEGRNTGQIIEIKGVVIDAVFPDRLPEILHAVEIEINRPDGSTSTLVAEVQQHLGDDRVRAVAMDSTDGLSRGTDVVDTGGPISVPVGERDARPDLERDRAAGRREARRPRTSSAGRSTASRPPSATSSRPSRSSRPASR